WRHIGPIGTFTGPICLHVGRVRHVRRVGGFLPQQVDVSSAAVPLFYLVGKLGRWSAGSPSRA
ncbi:MAG: hypothetical protein ACRDTJ_33780, partial [Pseudonocardiaceae bacterium]